MNKINTKTIIRKDKLHKLTRNLFLVHIFIKSVISLLRLGGIRLSYDSSVFKSYSGALLKELSNKGAEQTIKLFKLYSRVGQSLALGIEFDPVPRRRTIKGTTIPRDMAPLVVFLTGNKWDKRLGLTLLNIFKLLRLPPSDDISFIVEGGPELDRDLVESFKTFVSKAPAFLVTKIKPDPKERIQDLGYMTSSGGPNGPMLKTVHQDVIALMKDETLRKSIRDLLAITATSIGESLDRFIEYTKEAEGKGPLPISIHSKVSQLSEGGGKTRNIAIIDYWSQSALQWIHTKLMKQLSQIRSDATYNQEDGFKRAMRLANLSGKCFSLDLSSATDRFPIQLQIIVIKAIFGEVIGDLWEAVIAKRDFFFKGRSIRWGRGQPLGALSSWAAFTLTHHLFVRWCAGDPHYENYEILGDDIAIMDEQVALAYIKRMNEIGVEANMSKGFWSNKGKVHGEFAKRLFLQEDELSGLPMDLMLICSKTIYMIPDFIDFVQRRWNVTLPGSELYAPESFSFLSRKGKELLSIVLVFKTTVEAKVSLGYPWCLGNNTDSRPLYKRLREYYLQTYDDRISAILSAGSEVRNRLLYTKLINPIKESQGNHVSDMIIMSLRSYSHPINLLGMKLAAILSETQQDVYENLKDLDKYIVEFVPDAQMRSVYYDRKTVRNVTFGKTALKLFYEELKIPSTPKS